MFYLKEPSNHIEYLPLNDRHRIGYLRAAIKRRLRLAISCCRTSDLNFLAYGATFYPVTELQTEVMIHVSIWALSPGDKSASKIEEPPRAFTHLRHPKPMKPYRHHRGSLFMLLV